MRKEIEQPTHIKRPEQNHPHSWALYPIVRSEWIRIIGPQLGVNVEKWIIGYTLGSIVGDDFGALAAGFVIVGNRVNADISKAHLIERMNWELRTPELPELVRTRLQETLEQIKDLDFFVEDEYNLAKDTWVTFMNEVNTFMDLHPEFHEAMKYMLNQSEDLSPYWQTFLGQELE